MTCFRTGLCNQWDRRSKWSVAWNRPHRPRRNPSGLPTFWHKVPSMRWTNQSIYRGSYLRSDSGKAVEKLSKLCPSIDSEAPVKAAISWPPHDVDTGKGRSAKHNRVIHWTLTRRSTRSTGRTTSAPPAAPLCSKIQLHQEISGPFLAPPEGPIRTQKKDERNLKERSPQFTEAALRKNSEQQWSAIGWIEAIWSRLKPSTQPTSSEQLEIWLNPAGMHRWRSLNHYVRLYIWIRIVQYCTIL